METRLEQSVKMGRGKIAAATRIFRGGGSRLRAGSSAAVGRARTEASTCGPGSRLRLGCDVAIPWRRVAATPRLETGARRYGAPPPPPPAGIATLVLAADALYASVHCAPLHATLSKALRSPQDCCYLAHEPRYSWSRGADGEPVQDSTDEVLDKFKTLCADLDFSEVGADGDVKLFRVARRRGES